MMQQASSWTTGETAAMPVILIAAVHKRAAAQEAIKAISGRLVGVLDWTKVAPALNFHSVFAVLMVETEGAVAETLIAALPLIDAFAAALDLPVVVALDEPFVEIVAATMTVAHSHILRTPSVADRVAALATIGKKHGAKRDNDVANYDGAMVLSKLNEEVARIADAIASLPRHGIDEQSNRAIFSDYPTPFRQGSLNDVIIEPAEVRRVMRARRLRDQHFGSGLFEDPAWDILLDLFAADLEGSQVSVSSLCIAASVAPTTALRWIAKLTERGLLERHPDPFDRRRAYMELSPRAARSMRDHVAGLHRAGLPFG